MSFLGDIIPYFKSSRRSDDNGDGNEPDIGDQNTMKDSTGSLHGQYTISENDRADKKSTAESTSLKIDHEDPFYDYPSEIHEFMEENVVGDVSRIKRLGLADDPDYDGSGRRR